MPSSFRSARLRLADRSHASPGPPRSVLWTLLIGVDFLLLSNPLALVPTFADSLRYALLVSAAVALLDAPTVRRPRVPWALVAFLALAALSASWSQSPDSTFRAVGLYVLVAAVAALLASNVTLPVLVDGLTLGGVIVVAASYVALWAGLAGAAVPPGTDGLMAGVGTNRNILAYTLVLSLAAAVSVPPRSVRGWVLRVACVAVIVANVLLTRSGTGALAATAVCVTALGVSGYDAIRPARVRRAILVGLLGLLVVTALDARTVFTSLSASVDRNPDTLSGRIPLWDAIVDVMQEGRLRTGYGWGAVWGHPWGLADPNPVVGTIHAQAGFPAAHGHNSFLDVLPELGLVGVALCAGVYLWVLVRAVLLRLPSVRRTADPATSRFLLVGLVGHLTIGLTEPLFTIPLGFFVLTLLMCSRSSPDVA